MNDMEREFCFSKMRSRKSSADNMAKRIYSESNSRLYQYKPDGNFYVLSGGSEICLKTSSAKRAEANLTLQDALNDRFGTTAFKFKVGQLFPLFLSEKLPILRPRTYALYESFWQNHFEKKLGKLHLGNMNQRAWEAFCNNTPTIKDFQNPRNLMHQFLVWCEMKEFLMAVPTLRNPKHKRRRRKIVPPEHLKMIFQRGSTRLLVFLAMAGFMGMRRSEIMKLDWTRIDLVRKYLKLRDIDTKTDEGREIPLNSLALVLLTKHLKAQQDAELPTKWVFPNAADPKRHAGMESLMSAWRRCLLRCGLAEKVPTPGKTSPYKIVVQYTWHDLRATFEKYAHKSKDHTDTQREKMVGADIDVQKRIYVSMDAEDLRGLEEVVTNQIPELKLIVSTTFSKVTGKDLGDGKKDPRKAGVSNG